MDPSRTREHRSVDEAFRLAYGPAVATLIRVFGDIALAEDAVQEAFVTATERWPEDGVPPNPAGWIVTTARRRAIDRWRRAGRGQELEKRAVVGEPLVEQPPEPFAAEDEGLNMDDQLRLMFTCCHPALRLEHQIALTLRLLGGLTVAEVARSFLVSEAAMAKRLVRAKYKIKAANIPYRIPESHELPDRLRAVLTVVYLVYNTGADDPTRGTLRAEAIRLARSINALMPDEPEAAGLLALLLLNESRMPARSADGNVVLLRDQDRSLWDGALIAEGHAIVRSLVRRNQPGPLQLQAAIQAIHCQATTFDDTNWSDIVTLYDQLLAIMPTPTVALNRAIALGELEGPHVGLGAVDALAEELSQYHLLHAARAAALEQLGRLAEARVALERAAALAATARDRRHLEERIAGLATTD